MTVRSAERSQGGDVYTAIRGDLLNNRIAPSTRLTIDALARDLAVSATQVREALNRLEGDDLVVKVPNKGYRATELLTREQLEDLFQLRLLLEPWAARTVATKPLGNPARTLMAEARHLVRDAAARGVDRERLMEHDSHFHDAIMSAAGNQAVQRAFERTHCHLHLFRLCPPHLDGRHTAEEHQEIAAAIMAANGDDAEAAMRHHLADSFNRFVAVYDSER